MNRRKNCSGDVKSHNHPSYWLWNNNHSTSQISNVGRDLSDASIWSCELLPQGETVFLLETQEEGTVFPSLKKYDSISNCNMLNASWHKCKTATSKMSAGTPGAFTWFKRFRRKNYFASFRPSWKAAAPVWETMEKEGKRNLQLKEMTTTSMILYCSF